MRVEIVKIDNNWVLRFVTDANHVYTAFYYSRLIYAIQAAELLSVHVSNRDELPVYSTAV